MIVLSGEDIRDLIENTYGVKHGWGIFGQTPEAHLIGARSVNYDVNEFEKNLQRQRDDMIKDSLSITDEIEKYHYNFSYIREMTELLKILRCPLYEVPLHINGMYTKIARWRLEHNK